MNKDLIAIFDYMEREKGIKRDVVINAIKESLQAAAQKSVQGSSNVSVEIDPKTGQIEVYCEKEIVDEVDNPSMEISVEDARFLDPNCEVGQYIDVVVTPTDFGRIAAQKARQIITQKLRGAERDVIYEEYRHRQNEIISGTVKRVIRGNNLIIDLGKVEGILPARSYPKTEQYQIGDRVVALLQAVRDTENGGAEVVLSRSDPEFVHQLFVQEVPEVSDGTISIETIVREAGYRTKMIVRSNDMKVDPVGACVGIRGVRVKSVVRELNNEKIDIIPYTDDKIEQLQQVLAPIEIKKVSYSPEEQVISIIVDDNDFAIVLGRRGINARLIGDLLDVTLEVQKMTDYTRTVELQSLEMAESDDRTLDEEYDEIEGVSQLVVKLLISEGYTTLRSILLASPKKLVETVPGISSEIAEKIFEQIYKQRK